MNGEFIISKRGLEETFIMVCMHLCLDLLYSLQFTKDKVIRFVLNLDQRSHLGPAVLDLLAGYLLQKRVDQIVLNHVLKINSRTFQTI